MRSVVKIGMVGIQLGLMTTIALGQSMPQQVQIVPGYGTTGGGAASTVVTTNAFQKLFAAANPFGSAGQGLRRGCVVQNNGSHTMYVSEGTTTGSATTAHSYVLTTNAPGNLFFCNLAGGPTTLQGEIDLGGTAADVFYAGQW